MGWENLWYRFTMVWNLPLNGIFYGMDFSKIHLNRYLEAKSMVVLHRRTL